MNSTILTNLLKDYERKRITAEKDLEYRKNKLYMEKMNIIK